MYLYHFHRTNKGLRIGDRSTNTSGKIVQGCSRVKSSTLGSLFQILGKPFSCRFGSTQPWRF